MFLPPNLQTPFSSVPILLDKKGKLKKKLLRLSGPLDHGATATNMLDQVEEKRDPTWVWSFLELVLNLEVTQKGPKIQKLENPNTRIKSMFREDFRNPASLAPNGLPHFKDYKLHSQTAA